MCEMFKKKNENLKGSDIEFDKERVNIDSKRIRSFSFRNYEDFQPKTREELLALDLALALNDLRGLAFYLDCAYKYPDPVLREIAGHVKQIPMEKIKKSRGALFNYLVTRSNGKDFGIQDQKS